MRDIKNNNINAFGLLESLVAIVVFGAAILVGLSLIVKSLGIIKDNQVSDQAAAFMVTSLEYMRSPNVKANDLLQDYYYVLMGVGNEQISGIHVDLGAIPIDENTCESSVYRFDIDGPDSQGIFCNQLFVQKVDAADPSSNLIITSRIVYKLSNQYVTREIRGFKKYNIEL